MYNVKWVGFIICILMYLKGLKPVFKTVKLKKYVKTKTNIRKDKYQFSNLEKFGRYITDNRSVGTECR